MKEKQGGLIPIGLKRWPFKLIKHFANTTHVGPSPAGPGGGSPELSQSDYSEVSSKAAYSSLGGTKVLYATSLVLLGTKAKFL